MLLDDFEKGKGRVFRRINKLLGEQFGITLPKTLTKDELENASVRVSEQIQQLKSNGRESNDCPELAKTLLIKEGISALLQEQKLTELRDDFAVSGPYLRIVDWLSDFVARNIELGDDVEDALNQAMKEYRSSKWRFPDEYVRFDVANKAKQKSQDRHKSYTTESIDEAPMQGNDLSDLMVQDDDAGDTLSSLMSPDEVGNVQAFIVIPDTQLDPAVRGKLHDFYSQQGVEPGMGPEQDDWYYNQVANDFRGDIQGEMDEAAWNSVLDKSGRYKMSSASAAADSAPQLTLQPHEPTSKETTGGHAKHNMKRLAPKRKTEMKEDYVKQLRNLLEAEVDEAEIIIAVKGIGKSIQEMIEKIGRLTNEDLPPLSDQVRETYGPNIASNFQVSTSQSLQAVMDALYQSKNEVDQTVQNMASGGGDAVAGIDMDAPVGVTDTIGDEMGMGDEMDMGMDDEMDMGMGDEPGIDDDMGMGDDFGGDPAAAGPMDEPLGRAKKESVQSLKSRLEEMQKLVSKAKAIKENA